MEPKRILYINGGTMHRGGIESYMMNYYRNIDRERLQIDFIVHGFEKGVYDDEIEKMGGKIYHVPVKSKAPLKNAHLLREIFQTNQYKLVHSHMDAMSYVPLKIAEKCGIPIRIAHSHNTQHLTNNPIKIKMNDFAKKNLPKVATHLFACTEKAGIWLYGEGNENRIEVIPNAIETAKYTYNLADRKELQKQLDLNDKDIVIGHIGRFDYQKNHEFLIDMFAVLHSIDENYRLVMVGDGHLKETIQKKVAELKLEEAVRFVSGCADANRYYNVFDLFCLPSHFEGLAVVLIEAQTNGLSCIVSESVTRAADVTGNVAFLELNEKLWAEKILNEEKQRLITSEKLVVDAGYEISKAAQKLQNRYEELLDL